ASGDKRLVNRVSGKWEIDADWPLGAPDANDSIFITNADTKTITIDATTAANYPSTMTISDLILGSPGLPDNNTLTLNNTGVMPLQVLNDFTLTSGGAFNALGSSLAVGPSGPPPTTADNGSYLQIDSPATIDTGTLDSSHAFRTWVGRDQVGSLNVRNSQFSAHALTVGSFAQATVNFINSNSRLGYSFGIANVGYPITQSVTIAGGTFIATNAFFSPDETLLFLGNRGIGQMTISNANVQFGAAVIGNIIGSVGSLEVQGGDV